MAILPQALETGLEVIGIGYTAYFTYNYLLFQAGPHHSSLLRRRVLHRAVANPRFVSQTPPCVLTDQ